VTTGTWPDDKTVKTATFPAVSARYVRLTAWTEAGNRGDWTSVAEVNILGVAPSAGAGGAWEPPIGLPIVPVSAILLPDGRLLTFAAYDAMTFDKKGTVTKVCVVDVTTNTAGQSASVETGHEMFCTGLAILADGRILVNGGGSDRATTVYDPGTDTWTRGPLMEIARGRRTGSCSPQARPPGGGPGWSASPLNRSSRPTLRGPTGRQPRLAVRYFGIPRTYHSVALLLADGRVFSGGGGLCGTCTVNHADGRIFTPPYLLEPDGSPRPRPVLTAAPSTATPGSTITPAVTTDVGSPTFALVRTSAVTHGVNNDQRRIPLMPRAADGTTYALDIPADRGVVLPGAYLLFALDARGTPSVGSWITIA